MLKILVVDDEPWQVKTLASIIKGMKSEYQVTEASDGNEALDILLSEAFDVIITDIRMPGMSGLELIERAAGLENGPEFVILSGYGEFQYAQKAINFGVFEYLLKPVSKVDIEGTLDRLEKKFEQRKTEQSHKNGMIKKLESTLPVYIEHQLNRWISNDLHAEEMEEILEIFPDNRFACVLATKIKKYGQLTAMYNNEEFNRLLQHFKFRMKETLDPLGHSISFFYEKSRNTMVTILTFDNNIDFHSDKNAKIVQSFTNLSRDELGFTVTIGISNSSSGISDSLGKCCIQAMEAVEYGFIVGDRDVIHFTDIDMETGREKLDIHSFEAELSGISQKPLDSMTVKVVNDIFDKYMNRFNAAKSGKLKEYLHYAAIHMAKNVKHSLEDSHYDALVDDIRERIFESSSYYELKHVFMDFAGKLTEYMNNKENKNNYMVVQKCKKYIDENYMEDISLELMAGKFHFSPSYFSILFKSYAGLGFLEYLIAVRIEKAQFLLKNTNYKVYDISEKVGYKDSTYFNRIFKREVGISPYKFRQVSSEL
jgi:two-component system response regulator YesN